MAGALVIAEHRDGQVLAGTLAAITCAAEIANKRGTHYDIVAIGEGAGSIAPELAKFGARKVVFEEGPAFAQYLAQPFAHSAAHAANALGADFVVASASTFGKDLLPRLAVRMNAGMVSEAVAIVGEQDGKLVFKRPMWAGNVLAHVTCHTDNCVVSIRATDFDKAQSGDGAAEVSSYDSGFDGGAAKQQFVRMEKTESERPDLTEASVVVSGGRGLKDGENFYKVMEPLADALGAAIGASRAAVDSGFCPNDLQVGQTGKVVAPDLYIAVAISGAIQHLAGMKNSKTIVSINKDSEAPIFQISDYGLVTDAFSAVPELVSKLS